MEIGVKIKALRLQCGLTQEELGDRCELTKGYISQIENDVTSPSIATLKDLLGALGTDLKDFFSDARDEQVVFSPSDFFVKESDDQEITWLVPNSQKNAMEPIMMVIKANSTTTEDMPHEGEEFGYVLSGSAEIIIGKKIHKVKKGDSFYFTSDRLHYIRNTTNSETKILWVSCPPTF